MALDPNVQKLINEITSLRTPIPQNVRGLINRLCTVVRIYDKQVERSDSEIAGTRKIICWYVREHGAMRVPLDRVNELEADEGMLIEHKDEDGAQVKYIRYTRVPKPVVGEIDPEVEASHVEPEAVSEPVKD
jgi:hypothetical protein